MAYARFSRRSTTPINRAMYMQKKQIIMVFSLLLQFTLGISSEAEQDPVLSRIKLPKGFHINYFVRGIADARSMTLGTKGTIFVSTRIAGNVYALIDSNNDGKVDRTIVLARNLNMPNGIDFHKGDLYVAEVHRVLRFRSIEENMTHAPRPEVIYTKLPTERHHGWRYMRFGPDDKLYISIGAPCNICNRPEYAQIRRIDLNTKKAEVIARGVRNSVGFDWHPTSKRLWFSDNGRDFLGDDSPPDEINQLETVGSHFGFPYCHGGDITDPQYGKLDSCKQYQTPEFKLDAHVAPLGIRFYTGNQFPSQYQGQLFVAEHGSWNRSNKNGYRIMLLTLKNNKVVSANPFASGWLDGETTLGRPVDLLMLADGSLLVSDDFRGVIYRVWYQAES